MGSLGVATPELEVLVLPLLGAGVLWGTGPSDGPPIRTRGKYRSLSCTLAGCCRAFGRICKLSDMDGELVLSAAVLYVLLQISVLPGIFPSWSETCSGFPSAPHLNSACCGENLGVDVQRLGRDQFLELQLQTLLESIGSVLLICNHGGSKPTEL